MIKKILFLLLGTVTFVTAKAETTDYKLDVHDFSELVVVDGINVDYFCKPDSAGIAVFSCEPEMASHIMFSQKNDRLTIRTDADEHPIAGVPGVRVYSSSLAKVENSGDSTLRVHVTAPVSTFKAKQIGNGTLIIDNIVADRVDAGITTGKGLLVINGKAQKATITNVSTGPIDASSLEVGDLKCVLFSTGNIEANPVDNLRVHGTGPGAVIYKKRPAKVSNRSIGVKVHSGEETAPQQSETTKTSSK